MNANAAPPLKTLIHGSDASIETIAAHLDALDHDERMSQLADTTRADQRRLWALSDASRPLTLEDFVPASTAARTAVAHHGRNTLPLPRKHRFFRKPMALPGDGSERTFGYNDSPSQGLIGPGYFVLQPTAGNAEWEKRGAWVVNYNTFPDGDVPDGWPRVRPNSEGLQRFVFLGTMDFMRRVSEHVTIGAAYKAEKPLDHYFTLCREA